MRAFLEGLLYAVLLVALCIALLSVAGCATGVKMTDEERIACRSESCSAWTESELRALTGRAADFGYRKGWTDAANQQGRSL